MAVFEGAPFDLLRTNEICIDEQTGEDYPPQPVLFILLVVPDARHHLLPCLTGFFDRAFLFDGGDVSGVLV